MALCKALVFNQYKNTSLTMVIWPSMTVAFFSFSSRIVSSTLGITIVQDRHGQQPVGDREAVSIARSHPTVCVENM